MMVGNRGMTATGGQRWVVRNRVSHCDVFSTSGTKLRCRQRNSSALNVEQNIPSSILRNAEIFSVQHTRSDLIAIRFKHLCKSAVGAETLNSSDSGDILYQ